MKISDTSAWAGCVYQLVYPGILGSMIYDVAEILRGSHTCDWFEATKILIVLLFVVDYLHMMNDLKASEIRKPRPIALDALISLGFCVVYWSATREDYHRVFIGLTFIFALMLVYPRPETLKNWRFLVSRACASLVTVAALIAAFKWHLNGGVWVPFVLLVIFIVYAAHVFVFTEKARLA